MTNREECCLPGDFTVTPIHGGYLIGEAMPQLGPGPWWTYVAIMEGLPEAINQARTLARRADSRAWFFEGGSNYRAIPLDESPFSV